MSHDEAFPVHLAKKLYNQLRRELEKGEASRENDVSRCFFASLGAVQFA